MKSTMKIDANGTKFWKNNKDQFHRENGPAIECPNGNKSYWINGLRHREDGPAIEWVDYKEYYIHGKRHRENGPAIIWTDGCKDYYINGRLLTHEQFKNYKLKKRLQELIC